MSRFYEAMQRALEQQTEKSGAQASTAAEPAQPSPVVDQPVVMPFDPDATTPVHGGVFEDQTHLESSQQDVPVEPRRSEPVSLKLAESPRARSSHEVQPSYERLIQRLLAFRGGRRQCSVLVVSAVPGEGASTVARNLALGLSESHRGRVVLVDANLRAPSHHESLQKAAPGGLAEVLNGDLPLADAVCELGQDGISVLAGGHPAESPVQLLRDPSLRQVIASLQSRFDWVILDGPPVTTCPEASSIAMAADGVILVVQAERTRAEVVEQAIKALQGGGVALIGGVLNRRRYHIPEFIYKRL